MTVRKLTTEEWGRVSSIFLKEFNENPPPASESTIVVAEEEGEIVGLLTVQSVVHVEPLWIKDTHRGRYIIPLLVNKVSSLFPALPCAFAYTRSTRLATLLEYFGLEPLDWKVFRWRKSDG